MDLTLAYFLGVTTVLGLSWASREPVLQKLAFTLLFAWASSNLAVAYMGYERAPLLIPSLHALFALFVAIIGRKRSERTPKIVFGLYGAMLGYELLIAFPTRTQGTYTYYLTLNLLFIAQLLTVGATSAWVAVRFWVPALRQRSGLSGARRQDMG